MQAIRSILWVGPEAGLVRNGLLEAKSLDVVWAPNTETALDLPIASFEAVVLALEEFDLQRNAVEGSEAPEPGVREGFLRAESTPCVTHATVRILQ